VARRLVLEVRGIGLEESQLALAAPAALPSPTAARTLKDLLDRRRVFMASRVLDELARL
jgi:regulator of protease activity HflC (stomatin/prohibitin superfamily)